MELTKEKIGELMEKKSLTPTEKAAVLTAAEELGVKVNVTKNCRSCWEKALLAVYEAYRSQEEKPARAVSIDGYRLKNPRQAFTTFSGVVYNEASLPGLEVGKLPPILIKMWFEKAGE